MSYYNDVYLKRLNRYGLDYQARVQGQREREFENYLLKSVYRVDFSYNNEDIAGTLEPNRQNDSRTVQYLLVNTGVEIPNGTILSIADKDDVPQNWMVWWCEDYKASGYNRYIVLKMTHQITWTLNKQDYTSLAYFYGPGNTKIKDTIKTATKDVSYSENDNLHMFIAPYNKNLAREGYFEITVEQSKLAFVITDVDFITTPGVAYISVDPTLIRDNTEHNTALNDTAAQIWLAGGV